MSDDDKYVDPAAVTPAPAKKPRKPRTPKAKPPKKERVSLGEIALVRFDGCDRLVLMNVQPPTEVSHDINKVEQWASTQPGLAGMEGILMIRMYNAELKVTSAVKVSASIEILKKKEVPQNQQTV